MASFHHFSDIELVTMLQEAESVSNPAFEELYNRYWKRLLAVAFHRLGSMDEAEEVVQEVFYNLWKRRNQLQLLASPATYLATAVKYEVINRLAKYKRSTVHLKHVAQQGPAADNSTEEWLAGEEIRRAIALTVKALPEKCRIVYQLKSEKGYSQNQIAQELKISVKTVEAHLSRALKGLRTSLKNLQSFFL